LNVPFFLEMNLLILKFNYLEVRILARPTKSIVTKTGAMTKSEIRARQEQEEKLKGKANNILPSQYLNDHQKELFNYIVDELRTSGILSNLDVFALETCVIAIDRLQYIETAINNDLELLRDKMLMASKDKYTKDLFRTVNELSLSPQARAKLGNINIQAQEAAEDPLLKVLSGGKD
jgi:P27 family predicted phage terminase small subunit